MCASSACSIPRASKVASKLSRSALRTAKLLAADDSDNAWQALPSLDRGSTLLKIKLVNVRTPKVCLTPLVEPALLAARLKIRDEAVLEVISTFPHHLDLWPANRLFVSDSAVRTFAKNNINAKYTFPAGSGIESKS